MSYPHGPRDLAFDLPNFEYDRELLAEIADRYLTPEYDHLHSISAIEGRYNCVMRLEALPEDFNDLPLISDLAELFSSVTSQRGAREIYKRLSFFKIIDSLEFHIDNGEDYAGAIAGRSMAFNLPIRGCCDAPTVWLDKFGGNIMHEHRWRGPALISTEHVHGSPDNQGERLFLTLGGFYESITDVKNLLIREGKV